MSIAYKVSSYNRKKKWALFLREFTLLQENLVLDVGYSNHEYSSTDNFIEKHYPYLNQLTALGVEESDNIRTQYPDVDFVKYNGGKFPFGDKSFDICWSNAVLEHVGGEADQVKFIQEISRVSKRAFFTTPNRWFPIETHTRTPFLHYLPKAMFDRYLKMVGMDWATGQYMHLLGLSKLRRLLRESGVDQYQIVKNKLFGLTLDFVIFLGDAEATSDLTKGSL